LADSGELLRFSRQRKNSENNGSSDFFTTVEQISESVAAHRSRFRLRVKFQPSIQTEKRERKEVFGYESLADAEKELGLYMTVLQLGYGLSWNSPSRRQIPPSDTALTDFVSYSQRANFVNYLKERLKACNDIDNLSRDELLFQHPILKSALSAAIKEELKEDKNSNSDDDKQSILRLIHLTHRINNHLQRFGLPVLFYYTTPSTSSSPSSSSTQPSSFSDKAASSTPAAKRLRTNKGNPIPGNLNSKRSKKRKSSDSKNDTNGDQEVVHTSKRARSEAENGRDGGDEMDCD